MAGRLQRTYTNFAGGQNNFAGVAANPIILDNGQTEALMFAESSQNWEMSEAGLLKHPGDIAVITTPEDAIVTGEYDWNGEHIVTKNGKVFTVAGAVETQIYTGHTADKYYQFTEWDDGAGTEVLVMCNGTDVPLYYDGTTCTTITFTDPDSIWNDARPKGAEVSQGNILFWGDPT